MIASQYDVVVVGAGCAGLTAAIGLSRAGLAVTVIEADPMPGGATQIGGVCFTENLAQADILGEAGVEALAWERRLIVRGSFVTDGRRLAGSTYRDANAFRHCYTVLRPIFDPHLAQIALTYGVALMTETTVESLIRDGRRVIGIATTRGPLYANLVFLAEGDAGHLVSREGLDRSNDPRDMPAFLYRLQQVIDLPPGALEETFHVGPEQGVVHDLLLRNHGRARLNVRGCVCTNRQSLTLSVVLPAESLGQHFNGEPRQLLDWFADMPALRPWWRDGRRGAWTAKLVRAGGPRDIPYLVEDGLAVGGAGAGLGVDFPVRNSTGPATATGLLLSRAAARIRAEGGDFSRAQLQRHYLEPMRQTRYWKDMEFLQRWPGYLKRTRVLFDGELDLLLDSAVVWARPRRWLPGKLLGWFRVLSRLGWRQWSELHKDLLDLGHALRLREVTSRPALGRVLLDGALNAFRDLVRHPRPHLPPRGELRIHFCTADEEGTARSAPLLLRQWFGRFRPVLASAGHILYRNEDTPLSAKLTRIVELLVRQINLLDLLALAWIGALTILTCTARAAAGYLFRRLRRPRRDAFAADADAPDNEDEERTQPSQPDPLGTGPCIHIVSKSSQPRQRAEAVRSLPHVCPTGVFEVRGQPPQTVEAAVHSERCIRCEACWRTNPLVDWAGGGLALLPSPVFSPVLTHLLEAEDRAGLVRPAAPRQVDPWGARDGNHPMPADADACSRAARLLDQLEQKLHEFDRALVNGPAFVDRGRSDHLEMLARYAQQLALCAEELLRESARSRGAEAMRRPVLELAAALVAKLQERTRRTWDGRFAWAADDGRLLRQHHLPGLRRLLVGTASGEWRVASGEHLFSRHSPLATRHSPRVDDAAVKHLLSGIAARRLLLESLDALTTPDRSARGELLAALATEVRDGLTSQTAELQALLDGTNRYPANDRQSADEVYRRHGSELLADTQQIYALFDVAGDWPTLAQRRALLAEREEIQEAEQLLIALASDWHKASPKPSAAAAVNAGFARQAAHGLAGKTLLLRIHAWLEDGVDAQLALVLLRVWLDYAATLLDEFTLFVRAQLRPPALAVDRPLVEPGIGPPLRTRANYLAAAAPYTTGDFLLAPVDLLQPRLMPEMLEGEDEAALVGQAACLSANPADKQAACPTSKAAAAQLLQILHDMRERSPNMAGREEAVYLAEALALETIGRCVHAQTRSLDLEMAGTRLILADLGQRGDALGERCLILHVLSEEVMPRWLGGGVETGVRHLGRDVLELEALKADFRRRLSAAWEVFEEALGRNADVAASCFALAEAAAWLKAADSTLGRMAWLARLCQAEDRDEPAARQELGLRALAYCHAEVRDRLHRFDEDLASLRRGYYSPPVRAAALLTFPEQVRPASPPVSDIELSLRVLVVVEPLPAVLSHSPDRGERVLESYWTLGDADRAALETALRLRDASPECVRIDVAAFGPPRVGQALREVLSLGIEHVHLVIEDRETVTVERAAAALAAKLEPAGAFDLILGGDAGVQRGKRLTALVAGSLGLLLAGHAREIVVRATSRQACVRLIGAASPVPRERPLATAVLIEAGIALRPFSVAGYLAGLGRTVEIVPV